MPLIDKVRGLLFEERTMADYERAASSAEINFIIRVLPKLILIILVFITVLILEMVNTALTRSSN